MSAFLRSAPTDAALQPLWTSDPFAAAILASCAKKPPRCEERRQVYAITADTWHVYVGKRADKLRAIKQQYGERLIEAERTGAAVSWHDGWPSVEDAIDAAVEGKVCGQVDETHRIAAGEQP